MNTTISSTVEISAADLRKSARIEKALSEVHSSALPSWQAPIAFFVGAFAAGSIYLAKGDTLVALCAGVSIAALSIATACFATLRKTHAAVQALVNLREAERDRIVSNDA